MRITTTWMAALGLSGLGCGVIHPVNRAPSPPAELPAAYAETPTESAVPLDEDWWKGFADPKLDALVKTALEDNFDVMVAVARLQSARAVSGAAIAAYIPSVNGSADVGAYRNVINLGGDVGTRNPEFTQTRVQAQLSYEVDLWGRIYGQAAAAGVQIEANEALVESTRVVVAASVVDTWLQAIEQQATLALLDEQIRINETWLELTELRFRQGLATSLDVLQQRQQTLSVRSQRPPVEAALGNLQRALAVLAGKAPGSLQVQRSELPPLPPRPEAGVPARLLEHRPDVRASRLAVVAADFQVGSAIGARFPRLNLTGALGTTGFNVATGLFDSWLGNLVAGLVVPLTDQVRLEAEEQQARARLDEQVATYGKTVLTAMREVEDALALERAQERVVGDLKAQVDVGHRTLDEARSRYRNGLSDYLPVLQALETVQAAERRLVSAERQRRSLRVQLIRALGGAWTKDSEEEDPS